MDGETAVIAMAPECGNAGDCVAKLVARCQAGDSAAFGDLVELYQRRIVALAWRTLGDREDARDAAQETFLRAYKYLGSYKGDQEFAAWLYRIAVNVCRDHGRRRSRFPVSAAPSAAPTGSGLESLAGSHDVEAEAIRSQQRAVVARALESLSPRERSALVLRDLEGFATSEVAGILGSSESTVRAQLCSARAKLKRFTERFLNQTGGR